ncbi:disease resistance-like protein DSC1 [Neltuma alba]|uniref:disease resistance-like protein DSC1 n=1 Tax=Neltuma alba TaxID=207710 RepID=UPI0010A549E0|nr:disease resistance-like protein DSC1 [Prosopis alba]
MDATFALTLVEAILILLAIAISKAVRLISPPHDSCKDVGDSVATVSSLSNNIVAPSATKYDVFLSFRGEDTRDTFSSYLYHALREANIDTFMDHKLHKGDHISDILLKTIEKSEISLIIFSEDYAYSTWCMDELVHIMKCKDKCGRLVVPIFYNVDPSDIRKQNGGFGYGFAKLKQRFKRNQERVQEWENALIKSASLSGWDSKHIRPEAKLVKKIVKDILSKLNRKSSFHVEGLVGIDHQIQEVEELLSEARIVGIWGMGGIGKTTLASAVFDRLKAEFEASCFVENVRQLLEKNGGLNELLEKCLKELLKDEEINTYNLRSNFVRRRLHRKKILLVLDDVDNFIAAEDLIKSYGWFGDGSRIIMTSRDMQVLKNASAFLTYHVPTMDHHHALHLFSLKAFKQNKPFKNYLELSERAVYYCHGNPLALKVLGSFLHEREKEVWESALAKLNHTLHNDIFKVLKLSFDGLDDDKKNAFLDLVFFPNEGPWISLDCARALHADIDIEVLKDRSLIPLHALLVEMGLEISHQQLISNSGKPIRLWRPEDVYHFFNNDKGIEAIRCMLLDASQIESMTLRATHFRRMRHLMFLNVYKSDQRKPSKLNIFEELDYLSEELRFLSWQHYPLPSVPLQSCAKNLIELKNAS